MPDEYSKLIEEAYDEFVTYPEWTIEMRVLSALEKALAQNEALREAIEHLTGTHRG